MKMHCQCHSVAVAYGWVVDSRLAARLDATVGCMWVWYVAVGRLGFGSANNFLVVFGDDRALVHPDVLLTFRLQTLAWSFNASSQLAIMC